MKRKLFRLGTFLVTMVMFVMLSISVMAASSDAVTKEGITAQLLTDKASYKSGESVNAYVKVDNNTGKQVVVYGQIYAPNDVTLVDANPFSGVLQDGTNWTSSSGVLKGLGGVSARIIYGILAVLAVGAAVVVVVYDKKRKKALCIVFCMAMIGSMVAVATPARAANVQGDISLSRTITVDGKEKTLTANVSYVIQDESMAAGGNAVNANQNYLLNGDFEKVSGKSFESWTAVDNEMPHLGTDAHDGSYSLQVNNKADTVYQMVEVKPGVSYELTGYIKLADSEGSDARFGIVGYSQNEIKDEYKTFSKDAVRFTKLATNKELELENGILVRGDWMQFKYTVDSTQETNYLYIYLAGQSGSCYYDDLSLHIKMEESMIVDSSLESADVATDSFGSWDFQSAIEDNPLVSTKAHSGNYSFQAENKNEWIRQMFQVSPLTTYEISGWFNLRDTASDGRVKYEGYSENEISTAYATDNAEVRFSEYDMYPELQIDDIAAGKTGEWVYFSWIVQTDAQTKYMAVYFRGNTGLCMFDDLAVRKVQSATKLDVKVNSNHYYMDEEYGVATITPNTEAYPDSSNWTANCQVLHGEEVLWSRDNVKLGNGEVKFSFPIKDYVGEDFIFQTTLLSEDVELEIAEWSFDRYHERPSVFNEKGLYVEENGEVFHPVSTYHMLSNDLATCKAAIDDCVDRLGINLHQIPKGYNVESSLELLDYLQSKGAKAIVSLYAGSMGEICSTPENKDKATEFIKAIQHHDAIYAWAVQDEPAGHGTSEDLMREAYEMVRTNDTKNRPVYVVDQREYSHPFDIRNADVITLDGYPYAKFDAMTYTFDLVKKAVENAAPSGKPILTLLQSFERYSGAYMDPVLAKDPKRVYGPSGNAVRNMVYQSFMAGATGIGYYGLDYGPGLDFDGNNWETSGYSFKVPSVRTHSDMAKGIEEFATKEQDLMFEYFVEDKYPTFNSRINDDGFIRYESFVRGGKIYMIVLNKLEFREQKVSVPLTSNKGDITITGFKAKAYAGIGDEADEKSGKLDVKSNGSTLDITLAPAAAAVYIITPNEKIDWSAYPGGNNPKDTIPNYTMPKGLGLDGSLDKEADEPKDTTNLIKNGGFETPLDLGKSWFVEDWVAEDTTKAGIDNIYKKHGYNSLQVASDTAKVSQMIDVKPGEIYELTGYMRMGGARSYVYLYGYTDETAKTQTDAVTLNFDLREGKACTKGLTFTDASGNPVDKPVQNNGWYKFSYLIKVSDKTEHLKLVLDTKSGSVYYDTMALHKVDSTTVTTTDLPLFVEDEPNLKGNLIINGGFEALNEDGNAVKWKAADYTYVSIEKGIRKFGDNALKVTNKKANASQVVRVEPGETYQLHGYVYLEGQSARVQVGGYSDSKATDITDAVKTIEINTQEKNTFMFFNNEKTGGTYTPEGKVWNWFTYTFTVGDNTDHVKIVLTAQSGISYFDTIALQKIVVVPTIDEEEPVDPTNLIKNGGFETRSTDKEAFKFVDWTADDRENAFVELDTKRFGAYALKVGNKTARVGQIVDVEPGTTYELTGNIYMFGAAARVSVGGYSDAEAMHATDAAKTIEINSTKDNAFMTFNNANGNGVNRPTSQDWNKFTYTFTTGQNTEYVEIILTGQSGATVFDTIALHKAGEGSGTTPEATPTPAVPTPTPIPAPTPDTGLVVNGHFETTGTGEGNDVFANWTETGDASTLAATGYGDVGNAVQVNGTNSVEQVIAVESGATYELIGYVNMSGARAYVYVGSTGLHLDLRDGSTLPVGLTFEDANGNPVDRPVQNGGWYKFSYTVTAAADTMNLKLAGKSGLALFDNVTIRKIGSGTTPTPPPAEPTPTPIPTPTPTAPSVPTPNTGLVVNGGFESVEDGDFANWTETGSASAVTGYGDVGNAVQIGSGISVEQTIAVESGATYELTGYINMDGLRAYVYAGSTTLHFDLRAGSTLPAGLTFEDASGNPVDRPVEKGGWYKFSYTVTAAADTMNLKLAGKSGLAGFDNISIQKK